MELKQRLVIFSQSARYFILKTGANRTPQATALLFDSLGGRKAIVLRHESVFELSERD
jgi:hypothetical protein